MSEAEDRENELAALESIYEHNLHISKRSDLQKFEVHLTGLSNSSSCDLECTVSFQYTKLYPNEAPLYEIHNTKGLSENELTELLGLIQSVIQRSLGYIMIFDILSEVQEKLNSLCEHRLTMQTKANKALQRTKEMEEEAKFQGDRVTVESFLEWNSRFLAEMAELKQKTSASEDSGSRRLTGRELFLRDNRYDDSDLKFLTDDAIDIDDSLFADVGDINLSDDSPEDIPVVSN